MQSILYNQSAVGGKLPVFTEATFQCKEGYGRYGPQKRMCKGSGSWSGRSTKCASNEKIALQRAKVV